MRRARSVLLCCVLVAGCFAPKRPPVASVPPAASAPAPSPAPNVKPPPAADEDESASFSYGKKTRRDASDVCEPASENLVRAASAIVSADRSRVAARPVRAWDRKSAPKYLDIVDRRFALTTAEKSVLAKNGFVVPARLSVPGYAHALHDVYQSQLPLYVSSDAVLHAIYKGNDAALAQAERSLIPKLEDALARMQSAIDQGAYPREVRDDLDLYLTVARRLLAAEPEEKDDAAKPFVEQALAGTAGLTTTTMFGRARVIDWSQYAPRGHYEGDLDLERWFRASMWLSRLELNLVSRASRSSQPGFTPNPEETPREAVDALALADLAERAGVLGQLDSVETLWSEMAGKREDVSLRALLALRTKAGITALSIPDSAEKLKVAIGQDFQRKARLHYMPQGSLPLPAIATMLGPRVVPDTEAATYLAHATVADRNHPSFADIAFMLGHDRAQTWLAQDLATYPDLRPNLARGRALLDSIPQTDVYGAWLASIRAVAAPNEGTKPSFMATSAYEDMKVNTTVAAYGQIRHNYVLVAGQAYDEGGCEIPDAYVEPSLALYESLVRYAQRGSAAMKAIGAPKSALAYFARLESTLGVLVAIVKDELAGRPLSDDEKRWLAMASEIVPASSDGPGSYDGWYFDLFPSVPVAFTEHAFVADWFTSSNANAVVYAGAREPRLGLFVVDTNGEPRVMVGPVARAFEHVGPLAARLADKDAASIKSLREPWAASYTVAETKGPPLQIMSIYGGKDSERLYAVRSSRAVGSVTFELLGHHRVKMAARTVNVAKSWSLVAVQQPEGEWGEVLRVRAGEFTDTIRDSYGTLLTSLGGMPDLEWEEADAIREKLQKSLAP